MPTEIWAFLEKERGKLSELAPQIVSEAVRFAALKVAEPCAILFGAKDLLPEVSQLAAYGLKKVYFFETNTETEPTVVSRNIEQFIGKHGVEAFLFPPTPSGNETGARVAALLRKGFVSNCVDFEYQKNTLIARRALYGGRVYGYYAWQSDAPYVATVDRNSLQAIEKKSSSEVDIVQCSFKPIQESISLEKRYEIPVSELDIEEARVVVGIGGGVRDKKIMDAVEKLAELLNAVIGGSRVAVFRDLIPVEKQIGVTGKIIDSDIYIPIGISGATRHSCAIKNVKHVLPINIDKEALIFKFGEFGVCGDLYEIVPRLATRIEAILNSEGGT